MGRTIPGLGSWVSQQQGLLYKPEGLGSVPQNPGVTVCPCPAWGRQEDSWGSLTWQASLLGELQASGRAYLRKGGVGGA